MTRLLRRHRDIFAATGSDAPGRVEGPPSVRTEPRESQRESERRALVNHECRSPDNVVPFTAPPPLSSIWTEGGGMGILGPPNGFFVVNALAPAPFFCIRRGSRMRPAFVRRNLGKPPPDLE